ncbi:hypothetical protein KSG25_010405, partial [Escherichia coli]|nr:hypothetical protein [Escherichia coli]
RWVLEAESLPRVSAETILASNSLFVKQKRVIIVLLVYYPLRPFPPSRKRALALGKDVPWP